MLAAVYYEGNSEDFYLITHACTLYIFFFMIYHKKSYFVRST